MIGASGIFRAATAVNVIAAHELPVPGSLSFFFFYSLSLSLSLSLAFCLSVLFFPKRFSRSFHSQKSARIASVGCCGRAYRVINQGRCGIRFFFYRKIDCSIAS